MLAYPVWVVFRYPIGLEIVMEHYTQAQATGPGTLIVVLGMHRSGTSAITRALVALGAELGDRLQEGIAGNNDRGFFEDKDIVAFNAKLLKDAGADWDTVSRVDLAGIDPTVLGELFQEAVALLRGKCNGGIIGLKDPRISRLMPFWQAVFDFIGMSVRYVIAVRNPISVARSLMKRDGFGDEKSYLLWLGHVVPALLETRGRVRTLVDYDRLLDEPTEQLRRMASQLGVTVDDASAEAFGQEFVEEGLRHTRFSTQDLNAVRSAPSAVKRLFEELDEACRTGGPGAGFDATVEAGRQFLADIEPLLQYESRVEAQTVAKFNIALAALKAMLIERERRIASLETEKRSPLNA